ncbi:MAG TPA: pyridoxamine 5'-phosphate oxidase family protein [Egibacteraceae bacterium]|nr:pyridoxamine 5'-phosphate oxidase family protein [Egibacteraceae bacterium]
MTMPPTPAHAPSRHYERLTHQECLDRLQRGGVGRLAFSDGPAPVIVPVNYGMLGDTPVLRTAFGTVIHGLAEGEGVALEIDEVDPITHLAWSVLVRGRIERVTDPADLLACEALRIEAYAPGRRTHWRRIVPIRVTGRVIR